MKLTLLALFFVVSLNAMAGSECGLTDSKDESWVELKSVDLTRASNARINALPTLTKQQLIITAKTFNDFGNGPSEINNTVDAVEYLRQNSDGLHLSVNNYRVNRRLVTEVLHYPGDNANAAIFKTGTRTIIAFNGDDSITCK